MSTTGIFRVAVLSGVFITLGMLLLAPVQEPSNVLRVESPIDSLSGEIGVFRRGSILYASWTDIAGVLRGSLYHNPTTSKSEMTRGPLRAKVTGGNSFVVLTNAARQQSVIQLHHPVISFNGSFHIPLVSSLPLLHAIVGTEAILDEAGAILRIASPPASPFDLTTVLLEEKSNGLLIRIPASKQLADLESWMRQDGWLYVTIADARADVASINKVKPRGIVSRIVAIQSPTSVQLTFKLSRPVAATEILRDETGNDILISVRTPGKERQLLLEAKRREVEADLEHQRKRWKLDVVVIDPGHGGRDPGAYGVTGVREKDITLGVGLKLGAMIQRNMKDVKVVYTRKDDSSIPLYRRWQIANSADGKIFISIHCNSWRRKPSTTRGFEVYLLRPGRTQEAIEIAERENSVIELEEGFEDRYQQLTEENFILVTMAQSAYVRSSERFADIVQQELARATALPNRGVHQAGFLVLVGASMPNILLETAYLSNRDDERFLKSEKGQQQIADAMFKSLVRFKTEYEKLLLEGQQSGQP